MVRPTEYENIALRGPRKWGSSCELSSGRDGYKQQRIGGGLADRSTISQLSAKGEESWGGEMREEEGEGQGRVEPLHALPHPFLVRWRLVLMGWEM
jgi:hypothetical protein